MEDFYFTGWLFALLLGFIKMVIGFSTLNSLKTKNLMKLGLYYHPFSSQFKTYPTIIFHHIFYVFYLLILAPLFSWVSVIFGTWPFIAMWANKVDVPEKVKEIQYKMATVDLSKDEVLKLKQELEEISGVPSDLNTFDSFVDIEDDSDLFNDKYTLSVGDNEWPASFEIDPKNKKLIYDANTPDYDSIFNSIYEYKFEGVEVLIRTIEDSVNNYGKVFYHIKDNVVLISEIKNQCDNNKFMNYEEQIERYNKSVEWSKIKLHQLKFFIMSHHQEVYPSVEFRKIARQELERIKYGRDQFERIAKDAGCIILEEKDYTSFQFPEDYSESKKNEIGALFKEENLSKFNITYNELQSSTQIVSYLYEILGEQTAA